MYRVKHIQTGLYLAPVRGRWDFEKTSLTKTGKVYTQRRSLETIIKEFGHIRVNNAQVRRYKLIDGVDYVKHVTGYRKSEDHVFGYIRPIVSNFLVEEVKTAEPDTRDTDSVTKEVDLGRVVTFNVDGSVVEGDLMTSEGNLVMVREDHATTNLAWVTTDPMTSELDTTSTALLPILAEYADKLRLKEKSMRVKLLITIE